MKTSVVLGLFALMVVAAPVMAEENATFLALKDLPQQAQAVDQVQPLTDTELATIEGGQVCILCTGVNAAVPVNLGAPTGFEPVFGAGTKAFLGFRRTSVPIACLHGVYTKSEQDHLMNQKRLLCLVGRVGIEPTAR
jgi:hypothetical protein